MRFTDLTDRFRSIGIIPVIALEHAEDAEPLADALCGGGLPAAEVTFRTNAAAEVIRRMRNRRPEMLIGAGTILSPAQVDLALDSGASFLVSPGLNPRTAEYCLRKDAPYCPGVATASEIELALSFGLTAVKFFPAEPMGGLATIRALAAPYQTVRFMPTGGVTPERAAQYLRWERIFAVGGSWITPADLILAGRFDEIRRRAAEAAALVETA